MVAPRARSPSFDRISASSVAPSSSTVFFWRRHASEQKRTLSQSRSHFLRQVMVRPQTAQGFSGITPSPSNERAVAFHEKAILRA